MNLKRVSWLVKDLPCFGYEDLPPIMKDLNLDYFEEAATFVQSHPKVSGMVERNVFKMNSLGKSKPSHTCLNGCHQKDKKQ